MAANGISTLTYKAQRQLAKLELAAIKRAATGRRSNLDISQLPTVYAPGDNNTAHTIKNPHVGGLVYGRPWTATAPILEGLWRNVYTGFWPNDETILDSTPTSSGPVYDFSVDGVPENTTYEYIGYFRANYTGTWYFTISADDAAAFWIGPSVESVPPGLPIINFSDNSTGYGNVELIEGNLYPIKLLYANGGSIGNLYFSWTNGLTESRVFALDAAVNVDTQIWFGTDIGSASALLNGPEIVKTTDKGGIVTFDGISNTGSGQGYAQIDGTFNADFSAGVTISVWANIATGCLGWGRLIDFGNGIESDNMILAVYGGDPTRFAFQMWDGSNLGTNIRVLPDAIPFDQWHLYTLTGNGSDYYWYIDDQLVTTISGVTFLPNAVQRDINLIGGSNWGSDPNLKGSIATVELYARALGLDEITGLYNERKGRFV